MTDLSVVIPTLNEEKNLPEALRSVAWADQVIVVDSGSTDRTVCLAKEAGAEVIQFEYPGYGPKKKNWALKNLHFKHSWVFLLDADERVTPELRREIEARLIGGGADGYLVDREFVFMGRSLQCFRPNWMMRLFKHRLGAWCLLALVLIRS
jgi:glycosyltransferase involved in cell wall biosynthesis